MPEQDLKVGRTRFVIAVSLFAVACLLQIVGDLNAAVRPGPDAFGYSVATTTSYSFTNIATNGGTRTLDFHDDTPTNVNIGFTFNFYGSNYTTLSITPNGLITFGGSNTQWANVDITATFPAPDLPAIAVLWDDWETQAPVADSLYYRTDGPVGRRQLILQWNNVMAVDEFAGTNTVTFQARLLEGNNYIVFSYDDVIVSDPAERDYSRGAFATVGIRDRNGHSNNRNLLWSHNQAVITNGQNILFTRPNNAPTARNDETTTGEDSPVTISVVANDSDPDGNILQVVLVTQGSHGLVSIGSSGTTVTYWPDPDYNGEDTFSYTISDGQGGSASATVHVMVIEDNDPPLAQADAYNLLEDQDLLIAAPGVLSNDIEPEGTRMMAVLVTPPNRGTLTLNEDGSFSYSPFANINGTDRFVYRNSDGSLSSSNATVTLTITAVNDPPAAHGVPVTTPEDTAVAVSLRGTDEDGDSLSYAVVTQPGSGTLIGTPPSLTYKPVTNFHGTDLFTFRVSDGRLSATGAVFITVTPVNDANPVAGMDRVQTSKNTSLAVTNEMLLANDTDADIYDQLSVAAVSAGSTAGGSVSLGFDMITYNPPTNFVGEDTFSYTVSDGLGGTALGTVRVTISASLRINSLSWLPGGSILVRFEGAAGQSYVVETSMSLDSWTTLGPGVEVSPGQYQFEDTQAGGADVRFYRIRK